MMKLQTGDRPAADAQPTARSTCPSVVSLPIASSSAWLPLSTPNCTDTQPRSDMRRSSGSETVSVRDSQTQTRPRRASSIRSSSRSSRAGSAVSVSSTKKTPSTPAPRSSASSATTFSAERTRRRPPDIAAAAQKAQRPGQPRPVSTEAWLPGTTGTNRSRAGNGSVSRSATSGRGAVRRTVPSPPAGPGSASPATRDRSPPPHATCASSTMVSSPSRTATASNRPSASAVPGRKVQCGPPVTSSVSGSAARNRRASRAALPALSVAQERPISGGRCAAAKRTTQSDGQGAAFMSISAVRKPARASAAPR